MVTASSSSMPSSPRRWRQRVRLDGSIGGSICKYVSPVKTCQYGFSTQPHTTSSSERSNACCRYSRPAINRGEVAGRPRPDVKRLAHTASIRSHSIKSASLTKGCFRLICSRSVWRNNSPDPGIIGFGPIKTPEKFAGKRAHIISNPANSNHQNYPETRAAIGFADFSGPTKYDVDHEVTVTAGATEALMATLMALVHPGDEVIVIEPFYDLYIPIIQLAGGSPVVVPMVAPTAQNPRYRVDWQRVE